jgi:hypothetical protein
MRQLSESKLKSRYEARNRFQEPSLELSIKLHRLAGRYDNPMPAWFLAPIAGLKLLTLNVNCTFGAVISLFIQKH